MELTFFSFIFSSISKVSCSNPNIFSAKPIDTPKLQLNEIKKEPTEPQFQNEESFPALPHFFNPMMTMPTSPFLPSYVDTMSHPKIIIARISDPIFDDDSLDKDSYFDDRDQRPRSIRLSPRFRQSDKKHDDGEEEDEPEKGLKKSGSFMDRFAKSISGVFESISIYGILFYLCFGLVFLFVGYQLRKNEEHGNYVRIPTNEE